MTTNLDPGEYIKSMEVQYNSATYQTSSIFLITSTGSQITIGKEVTTSGFKKKTVTFKDTDPLVGLVGYVNTNKMLTAVGFITMNKKCAA